jgi:hypothetical protein
MDWASFAVTFLAEEQQSDLACPLHDLLEAQLADFSPAWTLETMANAAKVKQTISFFISIVPIVVTNDLYHL